MLIGLYIQRKESRGTEKKSLAKWAVLRLISILEKLITQQVCSDAFSAIKIQFCNQMDSFRQSNVYERQGIKERQVVLISRLK